MIQSEDIYKRLFELKSRMDKILGDLSLSITEDSSMEKKVLYSRKNAQLSHEMEKVLNM